mmetsp:Transcript_11578/g.11595  ORF Transcript_11578/g.11595 Transcript_11578/m.11595 type:complete len:97 (-) Transcript_11578:10-300(-)
MVNLSLLINLCQSLSSTSSTQFDFSDVAKSEFSTSEVLLSSAVFVVAGFLSTPINLLIKFQSGRNRMSKSGHMAESGIQQGPMHIAITKTDINLNS